MAYDNDMAMANAWSEWRRRDLSSWLRRLHREMQEEAAILESLRRLRIS